MGDLERAYDEANTELDTESVIEFCQWASSEMGRGLEGCIEVPHDKDIQTILDNYKGQLIGVRYFEITNTSSPRDPSWDMITARVEFGLYEGERMIVNNHGILIKLSGVSDIMKEGDIKKKMPMRYTIERNIVVPHFGTLCIGYLALHNVSRKLSEILSEHEKAHQQKKGSPAFAIPESKDPRHDAHALIRTAIMAKGDPYGTEFLLGDRAVEEAVLSEFPDAEENYAQVLCDLGKSLVTKSTEGEKEWTD